MKSEGSPGTVPRADERLRDVVFAHLEPLDSVSLGANDILIACAGFEDRASASLRHAVSSPRSRGRVILVEYLPEQPKNRLEEMRSIAAVSGFQMLGATYDRRDPTGMGSTLAKLAADSTEMYVDVSGMSRLLIVQALVATTRGCGHELRVLYSEAADYPPSSEEFQQQARAATGDSPPSYLSSGIIEVAAAPELSSVAMQGEPIRLVAFPSFDPSQLANLIQELQPAYTDLVYGVPPDARNAWRTKALRELNSPVLSDVRNAQEHNVCTLDYRETLDLLLKLYSRRSMFDRIVVAPTGSKMQAVAVGLFKSVLRDVQIVYPTPHVFPEPERYTLGTGPMYQLRIPMRELREIIRSDNAVEGETVTTANGGP
ncbi:MAG: hypothetical protein OXH32_14100 [Acidobacteria bacterium]|nr:hypothetical protein [Acidobacteriota bacterium]